MVEMNYFSFSLQVDPLYIYSPHCRLLLKDATRVDGTEQDLAAFVSELRKFPDIPFVPPATPSNRTLFACA